MKLLHGIGLGLWLSAAVAFSGEAEKKPDEAAPPTPAAPEARAAFLIVSQDKASLVFGNDQVGQLAEGTRLELLQQREAWSMVRIKAGLNWFQGWVRTAMTVPDTLKEVGVAVGTAHRRDVYENLTEPGCQFLEVPVKFEPTDKSPARVYFSFGDQETADLYLTYGSEKKILPYGFMRAKPMSTRRTFDRTEKKQVLLLEKGKPLIETYVFAVPIRIRDLDIVLKDTILRVEGRRR